MFSTSAATDCRRHSFATEFVTIEHQLYRSEAVSEHLRLPVRDRRSQILPPALRTRKLTVRLPQYQIGALQVLADDGRESVDAMLTRMFEELTDLNQERLARLIPGLAEAMTWPEPADGDRAC